MISIRRAKLKDIPTIMQFMEDHWLHGYALANNRAFFEWQFVHDGKVNIWIGIDDEIGKLYAIQSFIVYRYVDNPDLSGSVWLAIKSPDPTLAFNIQDALWQEMKPRTVPSPGLRPDAVKAFSLLGHTITKMDHYYRLADIENYKIALIKEKNIPPATNTGYCLAPIYTLEEVKNIIPERQLIESTPSKDYEYIQWRYFNHPIFEYEIWKITNPDSVAEGVLITRNEQANGAKSCKIVDFYGNPKLLGKITYALDCIIDDRHYEYIDIYSYGIPTDIYESAGLTMCDASSPNIIPNYFQPYSPQNSDIMLVKPDLPDTILFRGDSDQDKPRLLE